MTHIKVGFDVNGTLVDHNNNPKIEVLDLLNWFYKNGDTVFIWSAQGKEYAEMVSNDLFIPRDIKVIEKGSIKVDIAVDDMPDCKIGIVNIIIKGDL